MTKKVKDDSRYEKSVPIMYNTKTGKSVLNNVDGLTSVELIGLLKMHLKIIERKVLRQISTIEKEKWVSVDDRLPEAYETIISYNIHTDEVSTDYIDDEKRWDVLNPTHWMPLPQPPKEK